jgi:hypothetical protein
MTITLTREEAQQVLDALEGNTTNPLADPEQALIEDAAIELLRARLAQPEPETVADKYLMEVECTKCGAKQDGILTVNVPPQRNWQGLTDEEMFDCLAQTDGEAKRLPLGFKWFAEAIEAKLKEKNASHL